MSLVRWLFHETSEFARLDKLIKQEDIDLELLKKYSKRLHEKTAAVAARDTQKLRALLKILTVDEEEATSIIEATIGQVFKIISKSRLASENIKIEGIVDIKRKLKAWKELIDKQITLLSAQEPDWNQLTQNIVNEVNLVYELKGTQLADVAHMTKVLRAKMIPEKCEYLTIEEVEAIHAKIIKELGGGAGIRDQRLLDSAVNRPKQSGFGGDFYLTIYDKAAALLWSLAENQPFVDGNTRTAVQATVAFLKRNGVRKIDQKGLWDLAKQLTNPSTRNIDELRSKLLQLAA